MDHLFKAVKGKFRSSTNTDSALSPIQPHPWPDPSNLTDYQLEKIQGGNHQPNCEYCADFRLGFRLHIEGSRNKPIPRHVRPGVLQRTAPSGKCRSCWAILKAIESLAPDFLEKARDDPMLSDDTYIHSDDEGQDHHPPSWFIDWFSHSPLIVDLHDGRMIELFRLPDDASPWRILRPAYGNDLFTTDPTEPKCIALVRQWLSECQNSHSVCKIVSKSQSQRPTRILDLGQDDSKSIRLIRSRRTTEPYVFLSHRWGNNMPQTTKGNIREREKSIDIRVLPQHFRKSIQLARNLGIRYMWIDSFCIVQDDNEDWTNESLKMASIYRGAFLIIAASSENNRQVRTKTLHIHRTDKSKGIYEVHARLALKHASIKESNWALPRVITWVSTGLHADGDSNEKKKSQTIEQGQMESHEPEDIESNEQEEKEFFFYGPPPMPDENDGETLDRICLPLLRRGWIFQERLLSPRILYVGPDEIIWECSSTSRCQCSTKEWSQERHEKDKLGKKRLACLLLGKKMEGDPTLVEMWHALVSRFSAMNLTQPSDRLPALAGLAKAMETLNDHQYSFGMWAESMAQDLAWSVRTSRTNVKPRQSILLAPSWSWASVNSTVEYIMVEESLTFEWIKMTEGENSSVMGFRKDNELAMLKITAQVIEADFHIQYEINEDNVPQEVMLNLVTDVGESGEVVSPCTSADGEDQDSIDYAFVDESVGRSTLMTLYLGFPQGHPKSNNENNNSRTITQIMEIGGINRILRRNMRNSIWKQYKLPDILKICLVADIEGSHEMDMLTGAWRPDYAFWIDDRHHVPSWMKVKLLCLSKTFYIVLVETDSVFDNAPIYRRIGTIVFEPHHALGVIMPVERVQETLTIA